MRLTIVANGREVGGAVPMAVGIRKPVLDYANTTRPPLVSTPLKALRAAGGWLVARRAGLAATAALVTATYASWRMQTACDLLVLERSYRSFCASGMLATVGDFRRATWLMWSLPLAAAVAWPHRRSIAVILAAFFTTAGVWLALRGMM